MMQMQGHVLLRLSLEALQACQAPRAPCCISGATSTVLRTRRHEHHAAYQDTMCRMLRSQHSSPGAAAAPVAAARTLRQRAGSVRPSTPHVSSQQPAAAVAPAGQCEAPKVEADKAAAPAAPAVNCEQGPPVTFGEALRRGTLAPAAATVQATGATAPTPSAKPRVLKGKGKPVKVELQSKVRKQCCTCMSASANWQGSLA
jgi:hypothetical protein